VGRLVGGGGGGGDRPFYFISLPIPLLERSKT